MNTRPCALCRHLDNRVRKGAAFCWRYYRWEDAEGTVEDCEDVERADGKPPPGRVWFVGERER